MKATLNFEYAQLAGDDVNLELFPMAMENFLKHQVRLGFIMEWKT